MVLGERVNGGLVIKVQYCRKDTSLLVRALLRIVRLTRDEAEELILSVFLNLSLPTTFLLELVCISWRSTLDSFLKEQWLELLHIVYMSSGQLYFTSRADTTPYPRAQLNLNVKVAQIQPYYTLGCSLRSVCYLDLWPSLMSHWLSMRPYQVQSESVCNDF